MEQCFYGANCNRKECIYRHDGPPPPKNGHGRRSMDPCMPFLAGQCSFTDQTCRKHHPDKAEADRLIAKYKTMKCRHGDTCKTKGCLYIHPRDKTTRQKQQEDDKAEFPPLPSNPKAVVTNSTWGPSTSATSIGRGAETPSTTHTEASSQEGDEQEPHGSGSQIENSVVPVMGAVPGWYPVNGHGNVYQPPPPPEYFYGGHPHPGAYAGEVMHQQGYQHHYLNEHGDRSHSATAASLNINAKEFVPSSSA